MVRARDRASTCTYGKILNIFHGTLSLLYQRVLHDYFRSIDLVFETVKQRFRNAR